MKETQQNFWLPGWAMMPERCPAQGLDGECLQTLDPWPGYATPLVDYASAWTTKALMQWLHQQLQRRTKGQPVILTGWSMGAMLALCYANTYPDDVKALHLWAGTACFLEQPGWPGQSLQVAEQLRQSVSACSQKQLDQFMKSQIPVTPAYREIRRQWMSANTLQPDWTALLHSLNWLLNADLRDIVAKISMPVTVHHGSEDCIIPSTSGEALAQALPQSLWIKHENKGHALWL